MASQDSKQTIFLNAVSKVEANPESEPLPIDALVGSLSMWKAIEDRSRIFPQLYGGEVIKAGSVYEQLMPQQKLAICRAIGYARYPHARAWEARASNAGDDDDDRCVTDPVPAWSNVPQAERSMRPDGFTPSAQCQVEPPGSGKTAVIIYVAALAARNALIITNSRENAIQIVAAIGENTTLSSQFPVKLIRSNEDLLKNEFVLRKAPTAEDTSILKFGGVYGIAVIDVHTFFDFTGSSTERSALRMLIFASIWDLVVIDEVDSVSTLQMRQAFNHGAVGEPLQADMDSAIDASMASASASSSGGNAGVLLSRYKLNYRKLLCLSGTWFRGDAAGYNFLKSLGPVTYSITSRELEEMDPPALAKMEIVLVRCIEADGWVRETATRRKFNSMTPEKLRVCERLVRLHVAHAQKIMVFARNVWHVRMLERLFPFALAPTGDTPPREFAEMLELFKRPASQESPLLWITTTKGEVGMDVPDTCVVINMVNNGESSRCIVQRKGRASRKKFRVGWMYDLVGSNETEWSKDLAGEGMMSVTELAATARRYKLLFQDGYRDVIKRLTSSELIDRVDAHIRWLNGTPGFHDDIKDEMETTASASKLLNDHLVYGAQHGGLAIVDHVVTCVLGSYMKTEQLKCDQILLDTQSCIRTRESNDAIAARRTQKVIADRRKKLAATLNSKGILKRPRSKTLLASSKEATTTGASGFRSHVLLRDWQYGEFKVPGVLATNSELRAALFHTFQSSVHLDPFGSSVVSDDADALWRSIMSLRHRVNEIQFENDRMRGEHCQWVLVIGDGAQENCTFLHDDVQV